APARLRVDGPDHAGIRDRPSPGRPQHRGHRPAFAVPAGHGDDQRLSPPHRPLRGRARGAGVRRPRGRDRRSRHRAVLLPPGGAGAAGRRLRHPLPPVAARGPLPARPGPDPGRRRPHAGVLMAELKEFRLPDVGEGLTEADIVAWHVKPGDQVEVNQIIVEIETAKAVVELPSPWDGTVVRLLAEEGQTIDVGVPIIAVDISAAGPAGTGETDSAERS